MHLYPEDIEERLEFDRVKELLANLCFGEQAKQRCFSLRQFNQVDRISALLDEVEECQLGILQGDKLPLFPYENITEDLYYLSKNQYVLEIESIVRIFDQVHIIKGLVDYFATKSYQTEYPILYAIASQINWAPNLLKSYTRIFDEEKKIKPSASPALSAIYKQIRAKERQVTRVFDQIASTLKSKGLLSDTVESYRSGRRVLTVNAEKKRSIEGIIHDESSTGKTVFIEPNEVVSLQNELYELESDKRQEIYKILQVFSNELRAHKEDFELWQKIIIRLDFITAKAKLAVSMKANKPKLSIEQIIDLKEAYHPYLLIVNNEANKQTIPFDLKLDKDRRILVISGPNAGGKSVTMKAIGLIQLMIQSGMLVPVSADSCISIFNKLMADIGDQQSIEDDLSTYSSRLKNMQHFLAKSGHKTLMLMDEFGSGTDPKIGGALAESILIELNKKKAFGVVTTHYSNIKMYAHQAKGLINGAMLFDQEHLSPTYRLEVGKPGSSFAFEIAQKIGLDNKLIHLAKKKTGKATKAVDELLVDLQNEKLVLERELAKANKEKSQLAKLIRKYEELNSDLNFKKKKFKMETKEQKFKVMSDSERELREVIKELKEEKALAKAEALQRKIKAEKEDLVGDIKDLEEVVYYSKNYDISHFKVGDFVKLKKGGNAAEIIEIKRNKIEVAVGLLRMKVGAQDIVPAEEPIERKSQKSVSVDLDKNIYALESELDIRGYRKSEAELFITEFLDNAFLGQANVLRVIHGVGSGVLRKSLLSKLREYKGIKKVYQETERYGDGVTFIEI